MLTAPCLRWKGLSAEGAHDGPEHAVLLVLPHLPQHHPLHTALVAAGEHAHITVHLMLADVRQAALRPTPVGAGHQLIRGEHQSADQGGRAGGVQGAPAVGAGGGHQE